MHWALQYIGKPWTVDGFGPDAFHCWGLVWWVYRTHYGVELPKYSISPREILSVTREMEKQAGGLTWKRIESPVDGCVVAMSQGKLIRHVGVFLAVDGGHILHASDGGGVLLQKPEALRARGWNRVEFYQLTHG